MSTTLYRIFNDGGDLMYVGITDSYETRMRSHSEKRWWPDRPRITVQEFGDREEAAAEELRVIRDEKPKHNKIGSLNPPRQQSIPSARSMSRPSAFDTGGRRWLSQSEAADYLGVTDRTIRSYIARGAIKARRLPGSRLIRIDRLAIDEALKPVPSARSF